MATLSSRPIVIPPQKKFPGNQKHLLELTQRLKSGGIKGWNAWRNKATEEDFHLDFREIDLSNLNLRGIDLNGANLHGATMINTILNNALLDSCQLAWANISNAKLNYARLVDADLSMTNATGASFKGANLSFANLNNIRLKGAKLIDTRISGTSVNNIELDSNTVQKNLYIVPGLDKYEELSDIDNDGIHSNVIHTNHIEAASLLSLVTDRKKFRIIIDSMSENSVLLLGNFSRGRKKILNALSYKLMEMGFIPVEFDFDVPDNRDLIDTVSILASLSCFVIADLTHPRSTPLETMLITSGMMVPFAPIIQRDEKIFSMFNSLRAKYYWVLKPFEYGDLPYLERNLEEKIIIPCKKMKERIVRERKKIVTEEISRKDSKPKRKKN